MPKSNKPSFCAVSFALKNLTYFSGQAFKEGNVSSTEHKSDNLHAELCYSQTNQLTNQPKHKN